VCLAKSGGFDSTSGKNILRGELTVFQEGEYRLKISFGKLYKQPVSVAVDDFTMTPNCFLERKFCLIRVISVCLVNSWSSRIAPDKLIIESCSNATCKEPIQPESSTTLQSTDRRSWLVPANGLYRIELYGASGGHLPNQQTNNYGGALIAHVKLQRNQELSFVAGAMGTNPCVGGMHLASGQTKVGDGIFISHH
jgi:hypothetical protein